MAALRAVLLAAACRSLSALVVSTLELPAAAEFNLTDPRVQRHLLESLGLDAMTVRPMPNNVGLNGGIWVLTDPEGILDNLVVKSRPPAEPLLPTLLPEPEHFMELYRKYPSLANDPSVVFPSKIIACFDPSGTKVTDLMVMREAPGTLLGGYLYEKHIAGNQGRRELYAMLENVGRALRTFHDAYGKSHTDLQTSNIFVDEVRDQITFIDLGTMGQPVVDTDLEHLRETFGVLTDLYPPASFLDLGYLFFESGYYNYRSQAPQTPSEAGSFLVSLPTAHGDELGLFIEDRGSEAFVESVGDSGLVPRWNEQHPEAQVLPGQRLLQVEGRRCNADQAFEAIARGFEKGDQVHVWSASQGSWFTDGWILAVGEDGVDVEYSKGSLQKTLRADAPELRKMLELTFEIPPPADCGEECEAQWN